MAARASSHRKNTNRRVQPRRQGDARRGTTARASTSARAVEAAPEPAALVQQIAAGQMGNRAVTEMVTQQQVATAIRRQENGASVDEPLPPPDQRRMIRWGSRGREVVHAQERLNAHGAVPPLAVDGIFGPLTNKATRAYQRSHGVAVDGIIGPNTWTSLDGPATIGKKSGSGSGGAGGPGSSHLLYVTDAQTFSAPEAGTTMTTIREQIKAKQDEKPDPALGGTVSVSGVKTGKPEEIFVWNVLLQRAERQFWGGEIDVVTQIGPAPKGGGPAPVGQVTVRIDGDGNATAVLVARGAVTTTATFTKAEDAIESLKTLFGFSSVENGSTAWSLDELNKVHAALKRLPSGDRSALKDVKLVRDSTLTSDDGDALAGQFRYEASVDAGSAGTPSKATRKQSLHIADNAFEHDDISFVGDSGDAAPASFLTIVHEAAHAVETKKVRDASFAKLESQADVNNATFTLNDEQTKTNTAVGDFNTSAQTARQAAGGWAGADRTAARSFLSGFNSATRAVNAFANSNSSSKIDGLGTKADTAVATRDSRLAALPSAHPAHTDYADAVAKQDAWLAAARPRATAVKNLVAAKKDLKGKKEAEKKVKDKAGKESKRVEEFVKLVKKHKIPPLTEYAKDNWPNEPGEFFAEAYTLWLNDPTYLDSQAPQLKKWFDDGKHQI